MTAQTPYIPVIKVHERGLTARYEALRTDQFDNHLKWFVQGAVHEYRQATGMSVGDEDFRSHFEAVHIKIAKYLRGECETDGSFSDLECHVALEAAKAFGRLGPKTSVVKESGDQVVDLDRVYSMPKSMIIDYAENMMYDGFVHLPLWVANDLEAISKKDQEWKKTCEANGWEFPTKKREEAKA